MGAFAPGWRSGRTASRSPSAGACATRSRSSLSASSPTETAAGGDLDELRSQLAALRLTENPPGIDEAEQAALELQHVLGAPPVLATPARLDEIGAATRRLEVALGGAVQGSPFAAAMKGASEVVEALQREVEGSYRIDLG